MQPLGIAAIAVTAVIVLALIVWVIYGRKRRQHLREHFGPEYDRTVDALGNQRRAEFELSRREKHVRKLQVRPLSISERQKFTEEWRSCQARFVDDPEGAVNQADDLLTGILRARGYAFDNANDRIADISAAYPSHVADYRHAQTILMPSREASTEDLRNAFVHYRALFDEMLEGNNEELKRAS